MDNETFRRVVKRCKTRRDKYVHVVEWHTNGKYNYEIYFEKEEATVKTVKLMSNKQISDIMYSKQLVRTMLRMEIDYGD